MSAGYTLSNLQHITDDAAPIRPAMLPGIIAHFPGMHMFQSCGTTEPSPVATALDTADHAPDA